VSVALASAAANAACASLFTQAAPCGWLEVTGTVEKVAPRHTGRSQCGAVGTYRITRAAYSLELWNGRMDSTELSLRVVAPDGRRFSIRSDHFYALSAAKKLPRYQGDRQPDYDYQLDLDGQWTSSSALVLPSALTIAVIDDSGREIGTETIRIEKRSGSYRYSTIEL